MENRVINLISNRAIRKQKEMILDIILSTVGVLDSMVGSPIVGTMDAISTGIEKADRKERSAKNDQISWVSSRVNHYESLLRQERSKSYPSEQMMCFYSEFLEKYQRELNQLKK